MNGVPLWDVDLEMYMVFSEAEFAELKAKSFEVSERLDTSVDVALFPEISVSFVCGKHHGHPVIAGVTRNLFRAIATYNIHNFCISCRTNQRAGKGLPRATKEYGFLGKNGCGFSSAGLSLRFRPRSIPSRN